MNVEQLRYGDDTRLDDGAFRMLDLVLFAVIVPIAFGAGYATRSVVSRRRRTKYLKWKPYVRPSTSSQPPQFLIRPQGGNVAQMPRVASRGRRS